MLIFHRQHGRWRGLLIGLLGLMGLGVLGLPPLAVAQSPAKPAAGTVNHFYNGVDASAGYNILDNQSAEQGTFTSFSFSDTTFHSTDGAALTYTASGKPSWLTWTPANRTFFGTPNTGLLPSYIITVTATSATGSSDSLTFTLKVANVSPESGQSVPVFGGDPSIEFFIAHLSPAGTPLYPDIPIAATDANGNLLGYRFVAPTGVTIPFEVDGAGRVTASTSFPVAPGRYDYTLEAYDATGYQDTSHIIVNVEKTTLNWTGATSNDWHTATNWAGSLGAGAPTFSAVPDDQTHVYLSAGTPYSPTISAPAVSYWLSLSGTVSLTMNADLYVGNRVDLMGSNLNTDAATLTLGGVDSPIGFISTDNGDGWGNFRRINLAPSLTYDFGHPDTKLTFHNGTGLSEATVKIVSSAPPGEWACALARTYRVTVPGWTAGTADLQLRYAPTDGTCAPLKMYRAPAGTANWSEMTGVVSGGVSPNLYLSVTGVDAVSGYDFALGNLCASAITVTSNANSGAGSLRQAIAEVCTGGTITFADDYTITLASELSITKSLTIDGAGHSVTVSGEDTVRVFSVSGTTVNLNNLTVTKGKATSGNGGGIANESGTLNVTNSTFVGNSTTHNGGAIVNATGTLTVTNSTLVGNSASSNGGGIYNLGGTVILKNTIVANNPAGGNCNGIITNGGNNLDDGTTCGLGATNGSQSGINPQLGTLTNGVFPLNYNSPAIDGVASNAPNNCPATDQRGQPRADLQCDIGAYELQYTDNPTVARSVSGATATTFGPALVGLQRGGVIDLGVITVTKSLAWKTKPDNAIDAYWSITPTVDTGLNLTLTLCYTPTENNGLTLDALRF